MSRVKGSLLSHVHKEWQEVIHPFVYQMSHADVTCREAASLDFRLGMSVQILLEKEYIYITF